MAKELVKPLTSSESNSQSDQLGPATKNGKSNQISSEKNNVTKKKEKV